MIHALFGFQNDIFINLLDQMETTKRRRLEDRSVVTFASGVHFYFRPVTEVKYAFRNIKSVGVNPFRKKFSFLTNNYN